MLDPQMLEQLRSVFEKLENVVELLIEPSEHPDRAELVEMLTEVASTSPKIHVRDSENTTPAPGPQFRIRSHDGKAPRETGIVFRAIPGGHEFTTLIVAILNADGKGKMPDPAMAARIRRLNKNIKIKSFISLTCENCPDVVQALNQMAILHGSFHHEIIDGGYAQDEVAALGIQGVPSLVVDSKLIHSGRSNMLDLLTKMEEVFGVDANVEDVPVDMNLGHFDVLVVGGGPAGASAAIYSVRKGLSTAIITEKIGGQVQETKGIENLISVPYTEGPQLAAQLNQHLAHYPVRLLESRGSNALTKPRVPNVSNSKAAST